MDHTFFQIFSPPRYQLHDMPLSTVQLHSSISLGGFELHPSREDPNVKRWLPNVGHHPMEHLGMVEMVGLGLV